MRLLLITALAMAGVSILHADTPDLVNNSPFLPPGGVQKVTVNPNAPQQQPLELRGISTIGSETRFSVYDPSTQRSVWLKLGETGHDFVVRSYNQKDDSVTVVQGDQTLSLHLPKEQFVALAQPKQPQTGRRSFAQRPGGPGTPNQIRRPSADEQKRLEAIAAEVRRRRALRQVNNH